MKRLISLMMCAVSFGATSQLTFEFVFQSDSTVFLISDGEVNYWSEAEDICQSFEGHLATFSSLEENLAVFDIVGAGPWIGLIQSPEGDEPNGGWSWVKSESLLYENWFANEPNEHHSGEDFGQLYGDGGWNDIRNHDTDPHRILMEVSLSSNLVGCTNTDACNFIEQATIDDGSCHFNCQFCQDGTVWDEEIQGCISANTADINNDGCVQLNDLLDLLSAYGDCGAEESVWQCGDPLEYQGYDYETVQIGEHCWFAENLRAENYSNGDAVLSSLTDSGWASTNEGAVVVYGESETCVNHSPVIDACDPTESLVEYGRLYNGYAIIDSRGLCPSEWGIPTDAQWQSIISLVGGASVAGGALKADFGWNSGGNGNDSFGFGGEPGGDRNVNGECVEAGRDGDWWTSTLTGNTILAWEMYHNNSTINQLNGPLNSGFSVRCIKDAE